MICDDLYCSERPSINIRNNAVWKRQGNLNAGEKCVTYDAMTGVGCCNLVVLQTKCTGHWLANI